MRSSRCCPQRGWSDRSRKNDSGLCGLRCENSLSRKSKLGILAVLLVLLEGRLLSSNAIGSFGEKLDEPVDIARNQGNMTPAAFRPDPETKAIDSLLKTFEVDSTRRSRVVQAILRSSRKHNLDPRLVASIVIVESGGNPFAISPSDAVGIMQIHVPTWARKVDEESINLFKIEDNVDFGVRILGNYVKQYGRDEGVKRYNGWNPSDPASEQNAQGYLRKVQHVYLSH
jgi:soluble lytic murein transglycosylase-like protein